MMTESGSVAPWRSWRENAGFAHENVIGQSTRISHTWYVTVTETRTVEDLKKKYHKAVKEKATSEKIIKSLEKFFQKVHVEVLTMIKKAQQSLRRLDDIALKPIPSTQVDYLEMLIESEKREAKSGWKQRVKYLEVAKGHAETLSKVKDEKESQNLIKKLSRDVDV